MDKKNNKKQSTNEQSIPLIAALPLTANFTALSELGTAPLIPPALIFSDDDEDNRKGE